MNTIKRYKHRLQGKGQTYGFLLEEFEHRIPSAEAVQGEWIHDGQNFKGGLDWCHCSECGQKTSANGLSMYRFCPYCGARMNREESEVEE